MAMIVEKTCCILTPPLSKCLEPVVEEKAYLSELPNHIQHLQHLAPRGRKQEVQAVQHQYNVTSDGQSLFTPNSLHDHFLHISYSTSTQA